MYPIDTDLEEKTEISAEEIRGNISHYFGKPVVFFAHYRRSHERRGHNNRTWIRFGHNKARRGLLIGIRFLRNGRIDWYTDHSEWYPNGEAIPAFLVSPGPLKNPVYVPLNDLKLQELEK